MEFTISSVELRRFLTDAVQIGRLDMAVQLELTKTNISQRQAYKKYGQTRVDTWEKRGFITSVKQKGATSIRYYSVVDLDILEKSEKHEKF